VIFDDEVDPAPADSDDPAGDNEAPVESADAGSTGSSGGAAEPGGAADAELPARDESEPEPVAAEEPVAAAEPEPTPEPEAAAEPEPEPAQAPEAAAAPVVEVEEIEEIEIELTPRVKPEIPGADLIPDIVPEGGEALQLDAEALAAAEAEAEEARGEDADGEDEAQPIADAAIDLAAGARYRATGKRKTAVARVILKPGSGVYLVNGKTLEAFFPRPTLERVIRQPLETVGYEARMDVVAKLHGGGVSAQAGALRHGISRALIEADPNLRGELKRRGFLTRDPRVKERKKAGLKKARKRPQFSKR